MGNATLNSTNSAEQFEARFYQELLAWASDVVCVLEADATVRYIGPACERLLGRPANTIVGGSALAHVHPDDAASLQDALARAVAAEGTRVTVTFRCLHAGGTYRVLEATAQSRLNNPVVHGIVINARDVTERVRAEEEHTALLEHIRRSLATLVGMAGSLVQIGGDGGGAGEQQSLTESILRLACGALGARSVAVTLVDAAGAWHPDGSSGLPPEQEQQWRSGQPGASLREFTTAEEQERLLRDGLLLLDRREQPDRTFPYAWQAALVAALYAGTRLVGVLTLDLSEAHHPLSAEDFMLARAVASLVALAIERDRLIRERAEASAEEMAMRETNRRMDAFLALATHELRTPLTTSSGNIQIALRRIAQEEARGTPVPSDLGVTMSRALRALNRMNLLINDLLDISRLQADQLVMHRELCDLTAVVRDAVEELPEIAARDVRFQIAPAPIHCDADVARISQVVHNYLTNTLKYAPPESPVEVGLTREDGTARVWVRDWGPGIPLQDQPHIWERFYRVESIAHQPGTRAGLGLGLYISKVIIEQHGGEVGVDSTEGAGSTFWFTIPITEAVPSPADAVST